MRGGGRTTKGAQQQHVHRLYPPAKGRELESRLHSEEEGEEDVHVHQDIREDQVGVVVLRI